MNKVIMVDKRKFEKRFKELFFDEIDKIKIILQFNPSGKNYHRKIFCNKSRGYLGVINNQNSGNFWLSRSKIWSKLESEFTLNYEEVKKLTEDIIEEHYNTTRLQIKTYRKYNLKDLPN